MRRYKKKELLEIISKLDKVNSSIMDGSEEIRNSFADTLQKCQQIAINIGEYLETKGAAGKNLIGILEQYCEEIYQLSLVLDGERQSKKITKKIRKNLIDLMNGIQYDLPEERKKIVFLPYKASMWDCLESIWQAAAEDENCDVYVIPIPYYDKNPDGSLGMLHYEGEEYPEYVPIISWEEYFIPEHLPEVIYIHNPYDNNNYVTSVHPAFYSSELKKYTDMLIYVPYFVGINNGMQRHFCTQPGVLYADKVVVESEAIRKIYLEELQGYEKLGIQAEICNNWEEKIIALGSPKIDKVKKMECEFPVIPKEWRPVIFNGQGNRKKVILYNTTVAPVLMLMGKYFDKLEMILQFFRTEKDVALLWRPHPLMESTLCGMRPQLWERYHNIVKKYREEGWGIFDETADINRAIALSDAYYGDLSSVVTLYEVTGKPILIQNYES